MKNSLQKPQNTVKKTSIRIPSLNQIQTNIKEQNIEKQKVKDDLKSAELVQNKDFKQADLEKCWKMFFDTQTEGKTFQKSIRNNSIELQNGFKIQVFLINPLAQEELKKLDERLLAFLKKNLQNRAIHLELVEKVSKNAEIQNTNAAPVSNVEKFIFLTKKHPILKMLKERFRLEVEK